MKLFNEFLNFTALLNFSLSLLSWTCANCWFPDLPEKHTPSRDFIRTLVLERVNAFEKFETRLWTFQRQKNITLLCYCQSIFDNPILNSTCRRDSIITSGIISSFLTMKVIFIQISIKILGFVWSTDKD